MAKTKWNEWKSDRDNPKSGKEIFIKLKNDTLGIGGFVFALFVDRLNGYIMLTYQISGNTMQTFCTHNYFTKGDKWIYVEDLKNIEFIVMAKTIKEMAIDYRQDFIENGVNKDVANDHKDSFEIGANAVLEEIEELVKWGDRDPIGTIEALKERIWRLKQK